MLLHLLQLLYFCYNIDITDITLPLQEASSLCKQQGLNWSLPVIQTEEAHQSLVRFMMECNISSAWLGWQNVQLNNWTWIDGQICRYFCTFVGTFNTSYLCYLNLDLQLIPFMVLYSILYR